ncbi:MAG TPA: MFS transporter [Candidatus Korarchaeota archaeon]|nr:MFS transporter [Candidatus Korarchaeota archaeon]
MQEGLIFLSYKSSSRSRKLRRIKSLIALYLATFVLRLGFGQIALLLPWKLADLGVPIQSIGFIMASNSLAEMLAAFPAGFLSDRFKRKPIIVIGLAGASISFLLYLLADSGKMLFIAHATLGISEAMTISPVLAAIVDRTTIGERGQAMGLYNSAVTASYVLGPALAGMMAGKLGRDFPFYLSSLMAFISMLLMIFLLREEEIPKMEAKNILREFIKAVRDMRTAILLLVWVGASAILAIGASFIPVYLKGIGFTEYQAGWAFAILAALLVSSYVIFGRISELIGKGRMSSFGLALVSVGAFCIGLRRTGRSMTIGSALIGIGAGSFAPAAMALLADLSPKSTRGSLMGTYDMAFALGGFLGPSFAGLIVGRFGFRSLFWLSSIILLACTIPFAIMLREDSKRSRLRDSAPQTR